ncbi:MAG: hypothetical protein M1839_004876 [Geoglossum umbratile]|nr:MAG: hypothetical protein M1839_004876 [Geoglossum umbratile]
MDPVTAEPVNRYLEMLFFMSDTQIQWAQRFCSSFMDTTFNINNLRLPLNVLMGITNTGSSFPVPFCFVPSESKASFDFIFEKLKELVWDGYSLPKVIVGDQAKGLSVSLPHSMQGAVGQFCEWHAFENIRKCLLDDTPDILAIARAALMGSLKAPEAKYIKGNWVVKESFVCRSLIKCLTNLGVNSTQQAESMNATLKMTLSCQISILEACRCLVREVDGFQITSYTINLIALEWAATCVPKPDSIWKGSCLYDCLLPIKYGLSYYHWMFRSVLEGFPLPISLVHPCWWLTGSPVLEGRWAMGYHDAAIDLQEHWVGGFRDRGQDIVMESISHLLEQQSQLLPEQSERLMRDQEIPPELPPPLPSNLSLQMKKKKGSTRKRALTGAEASERQQKALTRAQKRARVAQEAQNAKRDQLAPLPPPNNKLVLRKLQQCLQHNERLMKQKICN